MFGLYCLQHFLLPTQTFDALNNSLSCSVIYTCLEEAHIGWLGLAGISVYGLFALRMAYPLPPQKLYHCCLKEHSTILYYVL